jgi:predicted nucleotidyltransferase
MVNFMEKRFLPKHVAGPEEKELLSKAISARLSREPGILFVYLHGSFVTGEAFRDIDVGLSIRDRKDFSYESDLSFELSKAIGHEVEVKVINDAPVAFQMAVISEGRLLFSGDDDARTDFIENVGRRYREYAHFRNIYLEAVGAER